MPVTRKPMRYAHSEGITDVCYDPTGAHLLTCGSDGDVRIYKGFEDSDPDSIRAGEQVTAISVKNNKIVTASDNNSVQAFTFPEGYSDGIITRFTASINHFCFNQSGNQLAAGASDFNIKIVTIEDGSHRMLNGHRAPVLSVAFDPKDIFLVSSSCDGTVKIWNLDNQNCVKTLNVLPRVNDVSASKTLCRISWQPGNAKFIAVPVGKEIRVYERDTWNHTFSLNQNGHSELVSMTAWSPCGAFLASASVDGEIIIWSVTSRSAVERIKHENGRAVCGLAWNPLGNKEIAYTDKEGQFGVCENVIPDKVAKNETQDVADGFVQNDMLVDAMFTNSGVDDSDAESLVGKNRQRVKNAWLDDEADEDDDDDDYKDIRKLKAELAGPLEFGEVDSLTEGDGTSDLVRKGSIKSQIIHTPIMPKLQPAFQPGSTPAHLMHRFMVWNSVGIVRCHNEDDISSIEVEFHDTSTHHPMHLTNHMNHTMAALSSTALLLACKAQDEIPSKLLCLHFGSWDSSKEWSVSMPTDEDIEVISLSETWLAVATDRYMIRIFTIGGVQHHIISIPGPVVSMSSHGGQLLIAYHAANPLPGEQAIGIKLLDLDNSKQVVGEERLTLSRKATLSWLGFSEEGTPVAVDSFGIVRLLDRSFCNTWSPVANTRSQLKSKSDHYWVVGLEETRQQLRCILCKGSNYPATLPRPLLSIMPLEIPLCEMTTDKGQLEEKYLRSKLLSNHFKFEASQGFGVNTAAMDQAKTAQIQVIMKAFALACKSDRELRAAELCKLLPDQYSVSLAIKYAARYRRINLAERLGKLAKVKAEEEAELQEEETDDRFEYQQSQVQTLSRSGQSQQHQQQNSYYEEEGGEQDMCDDQSGEDEDGEEDACDDTPSRTQGINTNQEQYDDKEEQNSLRLVHVPKKSKPSRALSFGSQSSQGRANPFRVTSPNKQARGACGKSFFDSVEAEKKNALVAKNRTAPETKLTSEPTKKRAAKGKQMTLVSSAKTVSETTKENNKNQVARKITGFKMWLDHSQTAIAEENPNLPEAELVKFALKEWRSLGEDKKSEWNEKAKMATGSSGSGDKKRKRENEEIDENQTTKMQKQDNLLKKIESDSVCSSTKLAGFAFTKT